MCAWVALCFWGVRALWPFCWVPWQAVLNATARKWEVWPELFTACFFAAEDISDPHSEVGLLALSICIFG